MVAAQVYVSGSVESWTVAGAFGQRRFVALTILLTIGLAAVLAAGRARRGKAPAAIGAGALRLVERRAHRAVRHRPHEPSAPRPRKNAYDAFVTAAAMIPDLAGRLPVRSRLLLPPRPPSAIAGVESSTSPTSGFPLERANGIQTMETCHALAERGHDVRWWCGPTRTAPARDPFAFYGLPRHARVSIVERAPIGADPPFARRARLSGVRAARARAAGAPTSSMTRDLGDGVAAAAAAAAARAARLRVARLRAGRRRGAAGLLATGRRRRRARSCRAWRGAKRRLAARRGLRHDHAGPARDDRADSARASAVAVVPTACADPAGRSRRSPDPRSGGAVHVGYAGHLYPWKGVDVLIDALARSSGGPRADRRRPRAEPDLARLCALARARPRARVTFTGHVAPAAVPARLRGGDVLVLPNPASAISTHFTSPLKLFEYMAAGRAIVASDLPAIREVLRDGENALLVPPGDPQALAAASQRSRTTRRCGASRRRRAFEERRRDYTWARRAERLEALFTAVLAGAPR